ncbi:2-(1,2-epoxy-1,2-dihydrophenyl)acetyl-CoA isomerase PaaG [Algihabitans sp.]|uniref:2-(1,2-epoxy-1,2-dihydrophenyl)acetyl-CoA isomerase PaaG n=1 Tax=Algihabitans sp. TaxID=2821514 RepID=UPI003BAB113A
MDSVLYEAKDGYALITLNRPDKLNAFTEEMHGRLAEALDRVQSEGQRALVLTGAGRGFCAGQDLSDRSFPTGESPDLGATLDRLYNPLVRKIRALELPVICAVNGVAAGAGANVALACDIVLAARSAKFIQAFAKIGLVPDGGGTWSLTRLVGEARAKALAMTAQPLSAEQAAAWGLIWQVVEDSELLQAAEALAADFASAPTRGLALTKQAIQAAATNSMDAQLDLERDLQRQAGRTKDYREGVAAFLEKRQPKFEGR